MVSPDPQFTKFGGISVDWPCRVQTPNAANFVSLRSGYEIYAGLPSANAGPATLGLPGPLPVASWGT